MSIQPLTFTGVSSLSDSLQQVLTRAVNIAKIPLQQLQNQDADLLQKKILLSGLSGAAAALGGTVKRLGSLAAGGALSATSSNPDKVAVQNTGGAKPISYTIGNISSLAAPATASTAAFADPAKTRVSVSGKLTLTVDDRAYTIDLTNGDNSLNGLRDAINKSDAGVTASVFTESQTRSYLSITANSSGEIKSLDLTDEPAGGPIQVFAVTDLGSSGTPATAATARVSDRNAPAGATKFTFGDQTLDLDPGASLNDLATALNGFAGIGAIVQQDNPDNPTQYWLAITAGSAGKGNELKLEDGAGADLFSTKDTGTDAAAEAGLTADLPDDNVTRVSMTGKMRLVVGGNTYPLNLQDNNTLAGLKAAIDAIDPPSVVTTTMVNVGSVYHLSVERTVAGPTSALQLVDAEGSSRSLLNQKSLGANARFELNGIAMEQKSNAVNGVVPGMSFTLLAKIAPAETVRLALDSDRSELTAAISSFVSAYNSLQTLAGQQVGANAGLLTGDIAVRDIQSQMRELGGYRSDGVIKSLAEMGITFDQSGTMSFDSSVVDSLSDSLFKGALSFFGSTTSGFGALAARFSTLSDPISGTIKVEMDGLDQTDRSLQFQIATLEDRINTMQAATAQRLQAADALLAQLESQQQMLDASIQSMNLMLYGKYKD
jgi:flagellar capping protein FliD